MAYIVGIITKDEREKLQAWGWEVEDAAKYGLHLQEGNTSYKNQSDKPNEYLMNAPKSGMEAVVIFVKEGLIDILSLKPLWQRIDNCVRE